MNLSTLPQVPLLLWKPSSPSIPRRFRSTKQGRNTGLQSLQELQIIWQAILIQISRLQAPMDSQLWDMYLPPWEPGAPKGTEVQVLGGFKSTPKKILS